MQSEETGRVGQHADGTLGAAPAVQAEAEPDPTSPPRSTIVRLQRECRRWWRLAMDVFFPELDKVPSSVLSYHAKPWGEKPHQYPANL